MVQGSCAGVLLAALFVFGVTACSGTDGVAIGDGAGAGQSGSDGGATVAASVAAGLPAIPEPPAPPAGAGTDLDAGPVDFNTPVHASPVANDAGVVVGLPDAGPPPPVDLLESGRVDCVATINYYRAALGRPALARWNNAEACVDVEAQYDAYYQTPHASFRHCSEITQNECPNWPGATPAQAVASCLQKMWNEGASGGNLRNMVSTQWSHVSCGFYRMPNGGWWLAQNYR